MVRQGMILLDTSVLIDFYRKTDQTKSLYYSISGRYQSKSVSVITEYEIYLGVGPETRAYWDGLFDKLPVLPVDRDTAQLAATLQKELKRNRLQLDTADLFIAATALQHSLPLATLNRKHFERVEGLELVLP